MNAENLYTRILFVDSLLNEVNVTKKEDCKRYLDLVREQEMCLAIAEQLAA